MRNLAVVVTPQQDSQWFMARCLMQRAFFVCACALSRQVW
jgi:hypothetical protein